MYNDFVLGTSNNSWARNTPKDYEASLDERKRIFRDAAIHNIIIDLVRLIDKDDDRFILRVCTVMLYSRRQRFRDWRDGTKSNDLHLYLGNIQDYYNRLMENRTDFDATLWDSLFTEAVEKLLISVSPNKERKIEQKMSAGDAVLLGAMLATQ